jgi:hypothetical protein
MRRDLRGVTERRRSRDPRVLGSLETIEVGRPAERWRRAEERRQRDTTKVRA